jgi:hypothetical protein
MSKPKVYISSTFFDLQAHRDALIRALRKTERFDVICMENYGTRNAPPLKKCLEDVDASEFYILLLGHRYGYIPGNEQFSITNLEYKKAIGDATTDQVATTPDYKKCVLPFILDDNYSLPDDTRKKLDAEEHADGPETTEAKKKKLTALKKQIGKDYTIDASFTTPDDLTTKVFGALIPELIDRNYADVVSQLILPEGVAYRCNRESVRKDFLYANFCSSNFYRLFIIHGEKSELPILFSNNISAYELSAGENSIIWNIEDYNSCYSDKFLIKLTRDLYHNIFRAFPDNPELSLQGLADKIIADDRLHDVVIKFDIYHQSWRDKYNTLLSKFFAKLHEANESRKTPKNCYLLINIKYVTPSEEIEESPPSAVVLDKLSRIRLSHIEQWVRTYFFKSTRKTGSFDNWSARLAQQISDHYFPDYVGSSKDFSMEEAIEKLEMIVDDFNNNRNLFANIDKRPK